MAEQAYRLSGRRDIAKKARIAASLSTWISIFRPRALLPRVSIMRNGSAKIIMDFLLEQARQQSQFLIDARSEFSPEDFRQAKTIIAQTMGAIYQNGLYPILKEHPDLTPPGLEI